MLFHHVLISFYRTYCYALPRLVYVHILMFPYGDVDICLGAHRVTDYVRINWDHWYHHNNYYERVHYFHLLSGIQTRVFKWESTWIWLRPSEPLVHQDRIKGLKLRHINAYCGCHSTWGAAVHEGEKESLVYCGSRSTLILAAAVQELQYTRDKMYLAYWGSCTEARLYTRHCGAAACRSG